MKEIHMSTNDDTNATLLTPEQIAFFKDNDLVCYPFRAPECIKLNAAIFRFTLVLSDLNVFT